MLKASVVTRYRELDDDKGQLSEMVWGSWVMRKARLVRRCGELGDAKGLLSKSAVELGNASGMLLGCPGGVPSPKSYGCTDQNLYNHENAFEP